MSKTLTPEDVEAEITTLYALSDSALLLEADAVALDFPAWLKGKFDLTSDQIDYLDTYSEGVKKFYGHIFAAAFITRSPIIFPAIPDRSTPRRIKETRANLFGSVSYDDGSQELTGTVEVNIEFALL
ncbi:MAG: hypothetical protein BGO31_12875 [Bacteroidetes bacterium 43-16]|nr:MAG: hypothetical protein BGO31_12875 [Bacteroidetes bacterium 43-16]